MFTMLASLDREKKTKQHLIDKHTQFVHGYR